MPSTFTLQLISLRCIQAQEMDGDEIYIDVGGHTVWSVGTMRMMSTPRTAEDISEVDFVAGRIHTLTGWQPFPGFEPDHYRIPVDGEGIEVRILERDMLLGDDLIGDVIIPVTDTGKGAIQLAFTAEGAHYVFNYEAIR